MQDAGFANLVTVLYCDNVHCREIGLEMLGNKYFEFKFKYFIHVAWCAESVNSAHHRNEKCFFSVSENRVGTPLWHAIVNKYVLLLLKL